jgi:hypothetical protein
MGGRAFDCVKPINIDELYKVWPRIYDDLILLGCSNIQTTGSTFRKQTMGDIDVAVEHNYELLLQRAIEKFGQFGVRRIGKHTISINWNNYVQVDIIVGKPNLITWTHFGPSNLLGVQHSSQFKGTIRHILMSAILYEKTCQYFLKNNEDYRHCYQFDIEEGIYETFQTKFGTRNNRLKKWKTLKRKLQCWNPQQICDFIFTDKNVSYQDIYTFEELFFALKKTSKSSSYFKEKQYQQIIDSFIRDIEINIQEKPLRIASSQEEAYKVLEQLKNIING